MLKSMTAYGRAEKRSNLGAVTAEIQSLNRKFLDLVVSLPKELSSLDVSVRKQISNVMRRGKVHLKLSIEYSEESPVSVKANLPLTRQIKDAWESMEKELHIASEIDLKIVAQMPEVLQFTVKQNVAQDWEELVLEVVAEALLQVEQMQKIEGKAISLDFSARIGRLKEMMAEVNTLSPQVKERNKEKLKETLTEIIDSEQELEERLLREACIFAEKVDIAEEVTRFFSHLDQFLSKMNGAKEPVGKTLEFLLQEMQREVNTVGSKAQDLDIARLVVEMKTEIERIREQVQNVE